MAGEPQQPAMPNDKQDEQTGRFERKYTDEEFLNAMDALGEATTREAAEYVGADHDTARRRLNTLADEGQVDRRKVAATILWNVVDEDNGAA